MGELSQSGSVHPVTTRRGEHRASAPHSDNGNRQMSRPLRTFFLGVLLALVANLVLAAAPPVSLRLVAEGFAEPLGLTHAGDRSQRLFVVEKAGTIRVLRGGTVLPQPFLDVRDRVSTDGERGLLGLAFHPRFAENRRFFVFYTRRENGALRVSSFEASAADPDRADPASEREIITIAHGGTNNHNGGQIAFGPDGFLYIATGDGGGGGDPDNNGQSLSSRLGKILRIDVSTPSGYTLPATNPFAIRLRTGHLGLRVAQSLALQLRSRHRRPLHRRRGAGPLRGSELPAGGRRRRAQLRLARVRRPGVLPGSTGLLAPGPHAAGALLRARSGRFDHRRLCLPRPAQPRTSGLLRLRRLHQQPHLAGAPGGERLDQRARGLPDRIVRDQLLRRGRGRRGPCGELRQRPRLRARGPRHAAPGARGGERPLVESGRVGLGRAVHPTGRRDLRDASITTAPMASRSGTSPRTARASRGRSRCAAPARSRRRAARASSACPSIPRRCR